MVTNSSVAGVSLIEKRYSSASVIGFTCGLLAFLLSGFVYFALPLALLARQQSRRGWQESRSAWSRVGLVLANLSLTLTIVLFVLGLIFLFNDLNLYDVVEDFFSDFFWELSIFFN